MKKLTLMTVLYDLMMILDSGLLFGATLYVIYAVSAFSLCARV